MKKFYAILSAAMMVFAMSLSVNAAGGISDTAQETVKAQGHDIGKEIKADLKDIAKGTERQIGDDTKAAAESFDKDLKDTVNEINDAADKKLQEQKAVPDGKPEPSGVKSGEGANAETADVRQPADGLSQSATGDKAQNDAGKEIGDKKPGEQAEKLKEKIRQKKKAAEEAGEAVKRLAE